MKNRRKGNAAQVSDSRTYRILTTISQDPYEEDYYLVRPKGKLVWKRKNLYSYQVRMYRTWKYNRAFQYKIKME